MTTDLIPSLKTIRPPARRQADISRKFKGKILNPYLKAVKVIFNNEISALSNRFYIKYENIQKFI